MRIKKKLHYILKYIALGLPLLFMLLGLLSQQANMFQNVVADLNDLMTELLESTNSLWYHDLLNAVGVDVSNFSYVGHILLHYPLYIFYVYLFDLMLDIICFMPKFMHKLMEDFING